MINDTPLAVRDLVRRLDRAALATGLPIGGVTWPYVSLVLVAADHDLSPILLLSELAEHSKAIAADQRLSLLFDGTQGLDQPLTGPRATLVGRAARTTDEHHRRRSGGEHHDHDPGVSQPDRSGARRVQHGPDGGTGPGPVAPIAG